MKTSDNKRSSNMEQTAKETMIKRIDGAISYYQWMLNETENINEIKILEQEIYRWNRIRETLTLELMQILKNCDNCDNCQGWCNQS